MLKRVYEHVKNVHFSSLYVPVVDYFLLSSDQHSYKKKKKKKKKRYSVS